MVKTCKKCGWERNIVNSFFCLCQGCNTARLKDDNKKQDKEPLFMKTLSKKGLFDSIKVNPKSKITFTTPKVNKTKQKIDADEKFYEQCFNNSDHECEECGTALNDVFRGDNGKIIARWRYSHIVPKSVAQELRHDINNINHLCLRHHEQWENRDKFNMKIFAKNLLLFPKYLKQYECM